MSDSEKKVLELREIIASSDNIVFFGGAGVSTESGIKDFRSPDGLYSQKFRFPPEYMLSLDFYRSYPEEFFDFYRSKLIAHGIKPNKGHYALAELESSGKLKAVITQNIDNLHQLAGSRKVIELHGSVCRNYCEKCGKFFTLEYICDNEDVPRCDECGGRIKPDVVLYGENLNNEILAEAINYISKADVLIIGGTSLTVYPAAGLIEYFSGRRLVLINKGSTPLDSEASLVINDSVGMALSRAVQTA